MSFARACIMTIMGIATVFTWSSCRGSSQPPTPYTALEFQVDTTKLGLPLRVSSLQFRVPAHWVPADSALLSQARSANMLDTSQAMTRIEALYLDSLNGSVLLARIHALDTLQNFRTWASARLATFRGQRPGWQIREDWLLINDLAALQIHSSDSIRVYFSFLFDLSPPVELNYVVPAAVWPDQVHFIESSLGTIHLTAE